jgi:diketogulonate reductase-like aldo/keto reductase
MSAFTLPSGKPVARLGQGAWAIGDERARRQDEIAALKLGLDLGLALIDTAELYGSGNSEELIAEAIAGRREDVYVVSKVLPGNATRRGTIEACKRSLQRLRTDYLDLYLLHWRESKPLEPTLEAFVELKSSGLIRDYGVSNFDVADLEAAVTVSGGDAIAANQVLYNLNERGVEWDLLPWCRERGIPVMAYTPLGNSGSRMRAILGNSALRTVAARHGATPAQIALAWLLRDEQIVAIPKAGTQEHVRENRSALDLSLTADDLRELDTAFPPPQRRTALAML